MGNADIKATFGGKRHELNVTTYQMVVLLLFNDAEQLTYPEIAAASAIPEGELKRTLQAGAAAGAGFLWAGSCLRWWGPPARSVGWPLEASDC